MILILETIKMPLSKENVTLGVTKSLMSRRRMCTRRKSVGTGHTTPMLHQEGASKKSCKQPRPRIDIGPGNPSWMWQDAVVADLLAPTPDRGHPSVRECDTLQVLPMYHHTNTMKMSRECEEHRVFGGAKISIGQERRALKRILKSPRPWNHPGSRQRGPPPLPHAACNRSCNVYYFRNSKPISEYE